MHHQILQVTDDDRLQYSRERDYSPQFRRGSATPAERVRGAHPRALRRSTGEDDPGDSTRREGDEESSQIGEELLFGSRRAASDRYSVKFVVPAWQVLRGIFLPVSFLRISVEV